MALCPIAYPSSHAPGPLSMFIVLLSGLTQPGLACLSAGVHFTSTVLCFLDIFLVTFLHHLVFTLFILYLFMEIFPTSI